MAGIGWQIGQEPDPPVAVNLTGDALVQREIPEVDGRTRWQAMFRIREEGHGVSLPLHAQALGEDKSRFRRMGCHR